CNTAVPVTPGVYSATGPSTGGGASNLCTGGGATNANWYVFTSPGNAVIEVNSCGSIADTRLSVYEGTCASLICLADDDDGCLPDLQSIVQNVPVVAGQTYYIEWDDRWDGTGFDWELIYIDCIAPLATVTVIDDCPNGQFSLEVNVTSLGDATALDITNTGGAPTLTAVGLGTHIVGPFAIGQVVDLELVHDQSAFCNVQYTGFEAQNCPIPVACG
ncbi:MAG: hypothetical protein KDB96_19320, partial [Flavobacteriales bacterium]|nr:hypothetical protein [Flavobacteriales bacterium]